MPRLPLHSPDLTAQNIEKIAALFPNCVVEAKDDNGKLTRKIDFDQLRQELSDRIVEGPQERYRLDWPGKREALLTANAPIAKTLRPCREESVDFDATKNLFIEGDNLDALKLLQETYLGKVKMIYIDPPYNTGNDFIYEDDFADDVDSYLSRSAQTDTDGNRMVINSDTNGRFHSDWLSMIYSRLRIARNLLAENGALFISIDDGEVSNLRKIADEVFGEDNFAAQIIWKKRNTPPNDKVIGAQHDYILVYTKSGTDGLNLRERSQDQISRYKNPDNHSKGPWVAGDLTANVKGGRYVESLYFPIVNPRNGKEFYPSNHGNWRFNRIKIQALIDNNEIYFGEEDDGRPKLKRFLCDVKEGTSWTSLWDFAPFNTVGSEEMQVIFQNPTFFESPKPSGLIKLILKLATDKSSVVLDFFSGSSTTAHAVMQLNAEDGGNRRFIMVQLPEVCDEKTEAYKAGYKTIAEIGKERIRRAGKKIKEENATNAPNLDIGFRVLKIDTSNAKDIYYTPDKLKQSELALSVDNIKEDRSPDDLLFQVMLDWGIDMSLSITKETFVIERKDEGGIMNYECRILKEGETLETLHTSSFIPHTSHSVYFVDQNAIAACFEGNIDEDFVKELAKRKPLRAVFRDNGFASDAVKINVEQIFKLLSPTTEVKTL